MRPSRKVHLPDPAILAFHFALGVFTFLSPCGYPMLPAYVAFYLPRGEGERVPLPRALARGLAGGSLAALGALLVLGSITALALLIGAPFKERVILLELVGGVTVIGLGILLLLGRGPKFSVPFSPSRKKGALGLFSFGALYCAVAASCVAPAFLGVLLASLSAPTPLDTTLELGAFAAGFVTILLGVTLVIAAAQDKVVRWTKKVLPYTERVSGALLILVGLYLVIYWARAEQLL